MNIFGKIPTSIDKIIELYNRDNASPQQPIILAEAYGKGVIKAGGYSCSLAKGERGFMLDIPGHLSGGITTVIFKENNGGDWVYCREVDHLKR